MFGALRLARDCADVRQREVYSAHFCAACHALRAAAGRTAAVTVNYDQTVLALLLSALADPASPVARPCVAVPLRRVRVQPLSAAAAELLALANLGAVEAKLRDDLEDEGWTRRLSRHVALWGLRGSLARGRGRLAKPRFAEVRRFLAALPDRQRRVERQLRARPRAVDRAACLTRAAAPSAALGGAVFAAAAELSDRNDLRAQLRRGGAALARFVYVLDAIEDLHADRRRGRFNALDAAGAGREEASGYANAQLARAGQKPVIATWAA